MDASPEAVAAARAYEALHVPALFGQWAEPVLAAAGIGPGDEVLDVACGTGALARRAWRVVGPDGAVTGVDAGPGMLAVAAEIEPHVQWVRADAADLPLPDDAYDAAACQFGLMFFPDRVTALREMRRCVHPGGRVVVAVWDALERSEAYPDVVDLLERRAGGAAADALRAPFVLGDADAVADLLRAAGLGDVEVTTRRSTARFPDVRTMVEADLRGWLPIMGVDLDDDLVEDLLAEAEGLLGRFVADDGSMVFGAPGHVVVGRV